MPDKDSGGGLALAALIKRAAADWRTPLLIIGAVGLVVVTAWFFVLRDLSPQSLSGSSQRLAALSALQPPAAAADPSGPAVSPAAQNAFKPARTAPEADRPRPLFAAKAAPARGPAPGPGPASASARAAPKAAPDGRDVAQTQPMARSESLPPLASDARAFAGRPVNVPLTAFSRQNKASMEQLSEPRGLKDDPQVKMPGRAPASRAAPAGSAISAGQPPASAAGVASGQPVLDAAAQSSLQMVHGGGAAAIASSGSGASAGGSELPGLSGSSGGEAGLAALGGGAGGAGGAGVGAGPSASALHAAMADGEKCSQSTSYYTPLVRKASEDMMALNMQALSCGPTIRCSFASNYVCTAPEDGSVYWWKRYYAGQCACARLHCSVKAKCDEVNSLSCQQLHACPMTAAQPCSASPCNY